MDSIFSSTETNKDYTLAQGRDVSALFNPRPLALIGVELKGVVNFATVAWITPLSHTPPLAGFALRASSRTMQMLRESNCCSISFFDTGNDNNISIVRFCGNNTGHKTDKGSSVNHSLVALPKHPERKVPVPHGALSYMTCTLNSVQEAGDHLLAIVAIEEAFTRCGTDEKGRVACTESLLCVQHDTFTHAEQ